MKSLLEFASFSLHRIMITPTADCQFEVAALVPSKLGGYDVCAVAISANVDSAAEYVLSKINRD